MAKNQSNDLIETRDTTTESAITSTAEIKQESIPHQTIVKKNGTGLSLLALLVALGLGGAGYYFGQQKTDEMQQKANFEMGNLYPVM